MMICDVLGQISHQHDVMWQISHQYDVLAGILQDWSDSAVIVETEVDRSDAIWVDYDLTFVLKSTFTMFKCVHHKASF